MPVQSSALARPIAPGTMVVSSTLRGPTLLSAKPADSTGGVNI